MEYFQFREILREYCNEFGIKFPSINKRRVLHREYERTLSTAPVPDNDITLGQFLDNANWTVLFNKKENEMMSGFCLASLPKAMPCVSSIACMEEYIRPRKEEGKTPMRTYSDAYASANVITPQSDTAVQRDYLLSRLAHADSPKENELSKLFNLGVDNSPKTFKELIDVIKNDKFTVDKKALKKWEDLEEDSRGYHFCGPFDGIIWDGKQPDSAGYLDAVIAKNQQYRAAKDTIMSGVYADGLKALQAFEAWLPTPQSAN